MEYYYYYDFDIFSKKRIIDYTVRVSEEAITYSNILVHSQLDSFLGNLNNVIILHDFKCKVEEIILKLIEDIGKNENNNFKFILMPYIKLGRLVYLDMRNGLLDGHLLELCDLLEIINYRIVLDSSLNVKKSDNQSAYKPSIYRDFDKILPLLEVEYVKWFNSDSYNGDKGFVLQSLLNINIYLGTKRFNAINDISNRYFYKIANLRLLLYQLYNVSISIHPYPYICAYFSKNKTMSLKYKELLSNNLHIHNMLFFKGIEYVENNDLDALNSMIEGLEKNNYQGIRGMYWQQNREMAKFFKVYISKDIIGLKSALNDIIEVDDFISNGYLKGTKPFSFMGVFLQQLLYNKGIIIDYFNEKASNQLISDYQELDYIEDYPFID